ncbi:MAG: TonB-dependent receptor plug domain-containing protein, partial [Prevotella sp.]|nr:TonB-dependent receptor plug domain-containing protein [Prevotella sp.]
MQKTGRRHRLLQLLIALLCLAAGLEAHAQSRAIELNVKDEPLPKVLRMIEKSSEYKFMFSNDDLNQYRVTKRIKSADIDVVMKDLLSGLPFSYSVKDKFVYIVNSQSRPAVRVAAAGRNEGNLIRGRVTDSKGEPLPGVTIKTDDPTVLGVTDENGNYTILIPNGKQVKRVTYSMLGMTEKTMAFNGKPLDVIMEDNSQQLGEVVVTGLFNYRSASFTGSAQTYSNEELKQVGNANLLKSLATLDPAFVIADNTLNGSNPNAFNEITIHGNSSFAGLQGEYTGNPNEPLFIIDGFESTRQQVFDLDMNRVKSVTILKDAAAKAIYGSKAANGVVVVETIEPESGRLRVTYTGDLNLETPDLTTYDLCNAEEKLAVELASGRYTGTSPYYQQMLREQYNEVQKEVSRGVDTYWLAKPLRTGVGQKHTLYFEGGDDRMRYSATAAYNGIAGVMKGSDRRTFSGNVKLQYRYKNLLFRNSL